MGVYGMNSPGVYSLGDQSVTAAGTQVGDWITGLDGMAGFVYQCRFAYGSGGNDCRVFLQASFDQGTTAVDLDCAVFGAASDMLVLSFDGGNVQQRSGSPPEVFTPTDGALADNTSVDGLMPDRLRVKIVSTGTYAGSTVVSPRIVAR